MSQSRQCIECGCVDLHADDCSRKRGPTPVDPRSETLTSNPVDLPAIRKRLKQAAEVQGRRPFAVGSYVADIQNMLGEIDRLTARVAELEAKVTDLGNPKAGVGYWVDECNKARAERDRLRAALTEIREQYDGCDNCIGQTCTWCIANAALESQQSETAGEPGA